MSKLVLSASSRDISSSIVSVVSDSWQVVGRGDCER